MLSELNSNEITINGAPVHSALNTVSELNAESDIADLWLVPLEAANTAKLSTLLSADELSRAARFRFEADRKKFVAARGYLRIILGKYLKINPLRIHFEYNNYGKPSIGGEQRREIEFNLSHSGDLLLVAVTKDCEIGVDIERMKTSFVTESIALEFLTADEFEQFEKLYGAEREKFFFDCWTRKEALIKGCGKGLSLPPKQIEAFPPSGLTTCRAECGCESGCGVWSVQPLFLISGYAAALAFKNAKLRLKLRRPPVI